MSWSMAIFTFLNAWCILFFFTLPLDIEHEKAENPAYYAAAPKPTKWKKKILLTTILALLFTGVLALIIKSGIISVRDLT